MLIALLAAAAAAQAPASTYTNLDVAHCRVTSRAGRNDGAWADFRCPGLGGIPLLVHADDDRFDLDAGVDNESFDTLSPFNTLGPRVEWRLRGGRPIAIIFRFEGGASETERFSQLAVATIGRPGHPGCIIGWYEGPEANAQARARADSAAASFNCTRDHVEGHQR